MIFHHGVLPNAGRVRIGVGGETYRVCRLRVKSVCRDEMFSVATAAVAIECIKFPIQSQLPSVYKAIYNCGSPSCRRCILASADGFAETAAA